MDIEKAAVAFIEARREKLDIRSEIYGACEMEYVSTSMRADDPSEPKCIHASDDQEDYCDGCKGAVAARPKYEQAKRNCANALRRLERAVSAAGNHSERTDT